MILVIVLGVTAAAGISVWIGALAAFAVAGTIMEKMEA